MKDVISDKTCRTEFEELDIEDIYSQLNTASDTIEQAHQKLLEQGIDSQELVKSLLIIENIISVIQPFAEEKQVARAETERKLRHWKAWAGA